MLCKETQLFAAERQIQEAQCVLFCKRDGSEWVLICLSASDAMVDAAAAADVHSTDATHRTATPDLVNVITAVHRGSLHVMVHAGSN
jgi:hypothetical protein